MRPLGSGGGEGDIRSNEGRARFRGGPVDVIQQRAISSSGQMACQGPGVKVLGVQPQADDFLGQIAETRIAEAARLQRLQVFVQNLGIGEGLFGQRRGQGIDVARPGAARPPCLRR